MDFEEERKKLLSVFNEQIADLHSKLQEDQKQQEEDNQSLKHFLEIEREKSKQQQEEINTLRRILDTIPNRLENINNQYQQKFQNELIIAQQELGIAQQELDKLKTRINALISLKSQYSQDIATKFTNLVEESFASDALVVNYNNNALNKDEIIRVAATSKSIEKIRSGAYSPLILTQNNNDIYWLVIQPPLQDDCYFLVPKLGLVINDRNYQTVEYIFKCKEYKNRTSSYFQLIIPARVKSISKNEWELVEYGEIIFKDKKAKEPLSKDTHQTLPQTTLFSEKNIPEVSSTSNIETSSQLKGDINCISETSILSRLRDSKDLEELISNYNIRRVDKSKVIKVAATQKSIEHKRDRHQTPLTFTSVDENNETFWLIIQYRLQNNCYFLVPKCNLIINERIYHTVRDIFKCDGYENRYSNNFKLILPAVVEFRSNNECVLVEQGELTFESN